MSLEQAIAAQTAAIEANTAALLKLASATGSASTAGTTAGAKDATKDAKAEANATEKKAAAAAAAKAKDAAAAAAAKKKPASEYEREAMVALLGDIKEKTGSVDAAREIIKTVGGVAKMAEIPEDKIDDVYLAAKAKIEELDGESSGTDDDGM